MKSKLFSWCREKSKLNIVIDSIMLILMSMVAGIGFLIKYELLPGFKRMDTYGASTELTFLNMDRHQWGNIHLVLSICLVVLVIVHIVLHWNMIACIYKKLFPGKTLRNGISTGILLVSFLFLFTPFFIQPEQHYLQPKYRNQLSSANVSTKLLVNKTQENKTSVPDASVTNPINAGKTSEPKNHHQYSEQERLSEHVKIYGNMTIEEVCRKYDIKATDLVTKLHVPENKAGYHLGWLRKRYHFEMNDVRAAVVSLQKQTRSLH